MLKTFLLPYAAILISYLILEVIWLGFISKASYQNAIGSLMRDSFITWPWLLFYLLYALAILVLVVNANVDTTAPWRVISMGALFGAAAYGAYNLTNYSILDNWPLSITLKDWAWGTFITTLCSTAGWWVAKLVSN